MALLDTVNSPEDLQRLAPGALPWLCAELRKKIIETTLKNGGHLASSLGAVELIVALLRTFNFREDRIVFDVGHQTYAYKLLTGRKDRFDTLRRQGGLSGYPKRDESPFDHFDVGHSSTSLSAALGYAKARDLRNENHHVVAVIGDGAMTAGMAAASGVPGFHLDAPEAAGERIVQALYKGQREVAWGVGEQALRRLFALAPGLVRRGLHTQRHRWQRMMSARPPQDA